MISFADYINEKYSVGDANNSYMRLVKKTGGIQKSPKAAVNEIIAFLSAEIPHLGLPARRETERYLNAISKFK